MTALAGGAVWCVLQLYLRFDLIIFSVMIGMLIAWILRGHGFANSASGALIAAVCTAVTCLYAGYLLAAAKVASFLGMPMRSTLIAIGPDMAAAVAWADLSAFHIGTVVLAVLLSAWRVWRRA
jgi:hypothetical protein